MMSLSSKLFILLGFKLTESENSRGGWKAALVLVDFVDYDFDELSECGKDFYHCSKN